MHVGACRLVPFLLGRVVLNDRLKSTLSFPSFSLSPFCNALLPPSCPFFDDHIVAGSGLLNTGLLSHLHYSRIPPGLGFDEVIALLSPHAFTLV